jgi:hypothetical protein
MGAETIDDATLARWSQLGDELREQRVWSPGQWARFDAFAEQVMGSPPAAHSDPAVSEARRGACHALSRELFRMMPKQPWCPEGWVVANRILDEALLLGPNAGAVGVDGPYFPLTAVVDAMLVQPRILLDPRVRESLHNAVQSAESWQAVDAQGNVDASYWEPSIQWNCDMPTSVLFALQTLAARAEHRE